MRMREWGVRIRDFGGRVRNPTFPKIPNPNPSTLAYLKLSEETEIAAI